MKNKFNLFTILIIGLTISLSSQAIASDAINNSIKNLIENIDKKEPAQEKIINRKLTSDILSDEEEEEFKAPDKSAVTKNPNSVLAKQNDKVIKKIKKAKMKDAKYIVLRSIDKITARTSTFEIPIGKTVKFADVLFIRARACKKASPLSKPESAAFLEIWEKQQELEKAEWIFSGWMLGSSPGLSAMSHPIFDVWVMECTNSSTKPSKAADKEVKPPSVSESSTLPKADKSDKKPKN